MYIQYPSAEAPLKLSPTQKSYLLFLGTFVAKAANNDQTALAQDWLLLPSIAQKWKIPLRELERTLLDALNLNQIFVGVPKTIEAFTALHQVRRHDFTKSVIKPASNYFFNDGIRQSINFGRPPTNEHPPRCDECVDYQGTAIREAKAANVLNAIYSSAVPNLEVTLKQLHPKLHESIVLHVYGFLMATPYLKLFEMSTCAVAILSGTHTPRQFYSHARGALNVGLPPDFIVELMEVVFEDVWQDDGIYSESKEVFRELLRHIRRKKAQESGQPIDPAFEEQEKQDAYYSDQLQRAERMAKRGQQHPVLTAGRASGYGETDLEEGDSIESQLERKSAATSSSSSSSTASSSSSSSPSQSQPPKPQSQDELRDPTADEIESTMKSMMRKRARDVATEVALRKAGANSSTTSPASAAVDDRWPIPPHVLDPSGVGAGLGMPGGMAGPGMGMSPGMSPGMSSGMMGPMMGGFSGLDMPIAMRSRL